MKLEDLWHHLSGYLVYLASAFIAIFIDVVVAALAYVLHVPMTGEIQLQEYVLKGTSEVMSKEEFIIRVVDGHLFLWEVSMTEIMQIGVLGITFIVTGIKAYIDIHNFLKKKKEDKLNNVRKRYGRTRED